MAMSASVGAALVLGLMPNMVMADAAIGAGAGNMGGRNWTSDPASGQGTEAASVTLESAVQEALSWHPSLAEAWQSLGSEIHDSRRHFIATILRDTSSAA